MPLNFAGYFGNATNTDVYTAPVEVGVACPTIQQWSAQFVWIVARVLPDPYLYVCIKKTGRKDENVSAYSGTLL